MTTRYVGAGLDLGSTQLAAVGVPSTSAQGATKGYVDAVNAVGLGHVTLTDASTVAVDASLGNYFRLLTTSGVGATRAMGAPSNPTNGQRMLVEIIQDGSGSRAVTWNAIYSFGTDVVSPTMTTTLNKRDFVGFIYNSTANKWYCLAVAKGY